MARHDGCRLVEETVRHSCALNFQILAHFAEVRGGQSGPKPGRGNAELAREGVGEVTVACISEVQRKSREIGLSVTQSLEGYAETQSVKVLVDR